MVSDDPQVREEARFAFSSDDEVLFAVDARDAWKLMKNTTPAVVVVDLQTGSAGGFGLTKDMRETSRLAGIPVLILLEREQDAWLGKQSGADCVRLKPIDSSNLAGDVRALLAAADAPS